MWQSWVAIICLCWSFAAYGQGNAPLQGVLPLVVGAASTGYTSGSAFLIGSRGVALTAAHVVPEGMPVSILVVQANGDVSAIEVQSIERHPSADVALLLLAEPLAQSTKVTELCAGGPVVAASQVTMAGYPARVQKTEQSFKLIEEDGVVVERFHSELALLPGVDWLSVTHPLGEGASGGPIFDESRRLVGIVAGEFVGGGRAGYSASRMYALGVAYAAFETWQPKLLGSRRIADELPACAP